MSIPDSELPPLDNGQANCSNEGAVHQIKSHKCEQLDFTSLPAAIRMAFDGDMSDFTIICYCPCPDEGGQAFVCAGCLHVFFFRYSFDPPCLHTLEARSEATAEWWGSAGRAEAAQCQWRAFPRDYIISLLEDGSL